MIVSKVEITTDATAIKVVIDNAQNLIGLRIWDDTTFKDYTQSIDLTSKLAGSVTKEIVLVTPGDLGIDFFDGIYFVEAEDSVETSLGMVPALNKYYECVIDKLMALKSCDSCLEKQEVGILNAAALRQSLEDALEARVVDQILNIKKTLDKFCDGDCKSCGEYGYIRSVDTLQANYTPYVIRIDGGSID